jgi:hypothetical protein
MISLSEREHILRWIDEAAAQGARRHKACELLGIRLRTLQRWRQGESPVQPDRRTQRKVVASHKLTESERAQMLAVANSAEFASLSPSQFVPILAERGDYIASESSFLPPLAPEPPAQPSPGVTTLSGPTQAVRPVRDRP